ncbi:MAG TPA: hypothetical protein VGZ47_03760 [Gemmataceae bacterium]|nr:hypothetical protein [Gemmataceae bacterium]
MRRLTFGLLVASVVLAGSGPLSAADDDFGEVGGKVIFNGKPLEEGVITFHFKEDQFVGAKIKDGMFRVDRVPVGTVKVTIESKKITLPGKFADPDTSGMEAEIKKGKNPVKFMLTG